MKKDKKWAQKEVDRYLSYEGVNEARNALTFAKGVINQLDEPEVLSQEWIDERKEDWMRLKVDGYSVPEEDLQNLLVPKQELPVIPKFVADWIEVAKESGYDLLGVIYDGAYNENVRSWMFEGKKNKRHLNRNKIARAWLYGYTVEKEQRYYVRENNYLLCKWKNEVMDYVEAIGREITDLVELKLTEQEIKDYDERFWPFAVNVKELEE